LDDLFQVFAIAGLPVGVLSTLIVTSGYLLTVSLST
jgi:hypothetical protein